MPDTVEEAIVVIRLHARLDAVEGKGGESGEDARGAGRYLGAILLNKGVVVLRDQGLRRKLWFLVSSS